MSLTGVMLAYERQLLEWVGSRYQVVQPPAAPSVETARLPLDSVLARVDARTYNVTSLTIKTDPLSPVVLGLDSRQSIIVDPFTGQVLADDGAVRWFTTRAMRWHRSLATGPTTRDPLGVTITGACTLAFLSMIVSGFVLWWLRQMSRRVRPVHTGEALGVVGQTIAAFVSAAAVVLAFTGRALVWRRFLRNTSRAIKVTARAA